MKIYTKTGDTGMSYLYDGSRLYKDNIIFSILGENDELNARIGKLWSVIEENDYKSFYVTLDDIRDIQSSIEIINSIIATPSFTDNDGIIKKKKECQTISKDMIENLETKIDYMEQNIPKLTKFILPGVTIADSESHLCRTQTRKCERMIWSYVKENNNIIHENILIYMNRLSDFFFVLSRYICYTLDKMEFFRL